MELPACKAVGAYHPQRDTVRPVCCPCPGVLPAAVCFQRHEDVYKRQTKHSIENPIEKQAVFENHHEPISDTHTWERVQELRKQRKRPNRYDEVGLFSGMLFCADCGSVMYQQRYQTDKRKQAFHSPRKCEILTLP